MISHYYHFQTPPPPRPNTTSLPTWVKPLAPRPPVPAVMLNAPWTAKPFHKLWLKWPESNSKNRSTTYQRLPTCLLLL